MESMRWELTQVARVVAAGTRVVAPYCGRPKFALVSLADLEQLLSKSAAEQPRRRQAGVAGATTVAKVVNRQRRNAK